MGLLQEVSNAAAQNQIQALEKYISRLNEPCWLERYLQTGELILQTGELFTEKLRGFCIGL